MIWNTILTQVKKLTRGRGKGTDVDVGRSPPAMDTDIEEIIVEGGAGGEAAPKEDQNEALPPLDPSSPVFRQFRQVLPLIAGPLTKEDMLSLRAVCRSWSQAVDDFIESTSTFEHQYSEQHPKEGVTFREFNQRNLLGPYRIGQQKLRMGQMNVHGFVEAMKDHPRNPFVGKGLVIIRDCENVGEVNWEIGKLLPNFGHHLDYLNLEFRGTRFGDSLHQYAVCTRGILLHTPNLRQLRLEFATNCFFEKVPEDGIHLEEIDMPQLRTLQLIFPRLRGSLTSDEFILGEDLIRRHSPQLERFDVEGVKAGMWNGLDWTNLKEFHVVINKVEGGISLPSLLKMGAPQLAKLFLSFRTRSHDMVEIMEVLNHFPKLGASGVLIK